jgi:hypothetical protein
MATVGGVGNEKARGFATTREKPENTRSDRPDERSA